MYMTIYDEKTLNRMTKVELVEMIHTFQNRIINGGYYNPEKREITEILKIKLEDK